MAGSGLVEGLKAARIIGSTRLIRRCIALYELLSRQLPNSRALKICENLLREDLKPVVEDFNDPDDFDAEDYTVHQLLIDVGILDLEAVPTAEECVCRTWVTEVPLTTGMHHADCPHLRPQFEIGEV